MVSQHPFVTTGLELPGMTINQILGPVFGISVRSMGFGRTFTASFRGLRRGNIPEFEQLLTDSRNYAMDRMVEHTAQLGGNGIIAFRFDASEFMSMYTEIVAYGTAVVMAKANPTA